MKLRANRYPDSEPVLDVCLRQNGGTVVLYLEKNGEPVDAGNICDLRLDGGKLVMDLRYGVNDKYVRQASNSSKIHTN